MTNNNLVTAENFSEYLIHDNLDIFYKFNIYSSEYKKRHGMCCQYDKPVEGEDIRQLYLPTQYCIGEEGIYYKDWNDNRNHRTSKKKCKYQKQEFFFSNYLDALDAVNNLRQVFSGLTHSRRDVIVLDVDEEYSEEHIEMIDNISSIYGIPHYNYIVINDRTNHYQIGWLLDRPYYRSNDNFPKIYTELRNALNRLFFGDIRFGNGFIKNPCCQRDMTTFWYDIYSQEMRIGSEATISPVNREDFTHSILIAFENTFGITINEYITEERLNRSSVVDSSSCHSNCSLSYEGERDTSDISSRHIYSLKYATEDCFRYMNANGGVLPSIDWLIGRIVDLQKEAITYINDPSRKDVEEMTKIISTANSILEFCRDRWKPDYKGKGKNKEYGNLLMKIDSYIKAYPLQKLINEGKSVKEAIKELNIPQSSAYRYLKAENVEDTLTSFYKDHHNDCGKKTKELCEEIAALIDVEEVQYDDLFIQYAAIHSNPYLDRRFI